jgi:hypothetical protein
VVSVKRYLGGATTPRRTILPLVDGIASLSGPLDLINDLLSLSTRSSMPHQSKPSTESSLHWSGSRSALMRRTIPRSTGLMFGGGRTTSRGVFSGRSVEPHDYQLLVLQYQRTMNLIDEALSLVEGATNRDIDMVGGDGEAPSADKKKQKKNPSSSSAADQ